VPQVKVIKQPVPPLVLAGIAQSATDLSVSEIDGKPGFEHPQSFSKLFKMKTSYSPLQFRQSFN